MQSKPRPETPRKVAHRVDRPRLRPHTPQITHLQILDIRITRTLCGRCGPFQATIDAGRLCRQCARSAATRALELA